MLARSFLSSHGGGHEPRPFPAREAALWALAGAAAAVFLLVTQAQAMGSVSSLLQVGAESDIAPYISGVFPDLILTPGNGNDGQIYFAIANDLDGSFVPALIPSPGLRYARLGFPWLASLGGQLSGAPVLTGMLGVVVASAAAASTFTMGLVAHFGLSRRAALGLFGNLGWFLGIRLLTPDPLGLALMLGGLLALVRGRTKTSYVLFAAAAITKEPYYAGALAGAIWLWSRRQQIRSALLVILPGLAVVGANAIANSTSGSFADAPHVSIPIMGIINASSYWPNAPLKDQLYTGLAIVMILLAVVAGVFTKDLLLRWCAWGWAAIGLVGSDWIWLFGNASARVLAPAWLFAIIALASALRYTKTAPTVPLAHPGYPGAPSPRAREARDFLPRSPT